MKNLARRNFIKFGVLGGIISTFVSGISIGKQRRTPTPQEVEGPFYPVENQKDKDFNLTHIDGHTEMADGAHIIIVGQITDLAGKPIENVAVEIWQANARGRYNHPRDPNPQPLDLNFQGWAIIQGDKKGNFRFKTVMPGAYPASEIWVRPPHIHFKLSRQGYAPFVTQMYFPNEKFNETDLLLSNKSKLEQPLMIARNIGKEEGKTVYEYNIVLTET